MNLKLLFLIILCIIFIIIFIYLVYSFFKKENSNKKFKYKYVVFYTSGRKLIKDFLLTEEENKEFNDVLNKSPLVKSYQVLEGGCNDKRC